MAVIVAPAMISHAAHDLCEPRKEYYGISIRGDPPACHRKQNPTQTKKESAREERTTHAAHPRTQTIAHPTVRALHGDDTHAPDGKERAATSRAASLVLLLGGRKVAGSHKLGDAARTEEGNEEDGPAHYDLDVRDLPMVAANPYTNLCR